ncbi:MAG: NAD-dependent epimerase/dehydratase family protein [Planctomycetota bacterium]|nr:NAD-dependent epimerase/dehydratase family protein [Planctomycetota bacterium]
MNVLVTGGTGFVGSHLIEQLLTTGVNVRALVRPGSNAAMVRSLGARVVTGDLNDAEALGAACRDCDVVYHAAARVEIVGSQKDFDRVTVGGTENLLRAGRAEGVDRFVYISSCGIYHPKLLATGKEIDETTTSPEPPRWFVYGRAKYRAENLVREFDTGKMEWVIVRLGYLYGPRNQTMQRYLERLFLRMRFRAFIGDGSNEMAMLYVEDAARAITLAGSCPDAAGKILIAGGNERVTQKQYFDALADGFGVSRIKGTIPYWFAFLCGWLGEYAAYGEARGLFCRSAVALTGLPQKLQCRFTQDLLGWRPKVCFDDGIRRAFDWYWAEYGEKQVENAGNPRQSHSQ